jgi:drug/metabolite transporter (DMT)-like permease
MQRGIVYALLAAILFGASTPLAKLLTQQISPVLLAGLLYAGSGLGLAAWLGGRALWRRRLKSPASIDTLNDPLTQWRRQDAGWLAGAIFCGGIVAPLLLLFGLRAMPASSAALLLNLEGVLTAVLAWFAFHENFDRRILLGMAAIVGAGIVLSWQSGAALTMAPGAAAIIGACFFWALDNNLTRQIAHNDAVQIAAWKGIVAGCVNLTVAVWLGLDWPSLSTVASAGVIGFCGYGLSLVLFVLALRALGSARTGAYFSAAPFVGALLAIIFLHEATEGRFWLATVLMLIGLWLHLSERHIHRHVHEVMEHSHEHAHDIHHQHVHPAGMRNRDAERHTHPHQHASLTHSHLHFPDIHHRHQH